MSLCRPLTGLLVAMLLLCGFAAAWHPLHEWMHHDAGGADDDCAVEMVAHGHCHTVAAQPVLPAPMLCAWLGWMSEWKTVWVESVFGIAAVQEHAPPVVG